MAYSDLDDVDYLVEDNVMDEFAYHRKWKRPVVEWHIGGASWEQNANAGNDSGNQEGTQQQRVNSLFEGYSITEEVESKPSQCPW